VERSLCGRSFLEMFSRRPQVGISEQTKSRIADYAIRLLLNVEPVSERQLQRHLYLPRSADGMGHKPKTGRAVIEAVGGSVSFRVASGR